MSSLGRLQLQRGSGIKLLPCFLQQACREMSSLNFGRHKFSKIMGKGLAEIMVWRLLSEGMSTIHLPGCLFFVFDAWLSTLWCLSGDSRHVCYPLFLQSVMPEREVGHLLRRIAWDFVVWFGFLTSFSAFVHGLR